MNILSARRAYEFPQDALRVSALATPAFTQTANQRFGFQFGSVATPMVTFGPVENVFPPGAVFNVGSFSDGRATTPIRFIHVEQRRVVIDVAGPTSAADAVYEAFRELANAMVLSVDQPAIGDPIGHLDWSDISHSGALRTELLFSDAVTQALNNFIPKADLQFLEPGIRVWPAEETDTYAGDSDVRVYKLETRSGTSPRERVIYSGAPLPTSDHEVFLRHLLDAMGVD